MLHHAAQAYAAADFALSVDRGRKVQVKEHCFSQLSLAHQMLAQKLLAPSLDKNDFVTMAFTTFLLLSCAVSFPCRFHFSSHHLLTVCVVHRRRFRQHSSACGWPSDT
jgi:hypothetical protein